MGKNKKIVDGRHFDVILGHFDVISAIMTSFWRCILKYPQKRQKHATDVIDHSLESYWVVLYENAKTTLPNPLTFFADGAKMSKNRKMTSRRKTTSRRQDVTKMKTHYRLHSN